jgi:hypothetical protein
MLRASFVPPGLLGARRVAWVLGTVTRPGPVEWGPPPSSRPGQSLLWGVSRGMSGKPYRVSRKETLLPLGFPALDRRNRVVQAPLFPGPGFTPSGTGYVSARTGPSSRHPIRRGWHSGPCSRPGPTGSGLLRAGPVHRRDRSSRGGRSVRRESRRTRRPRRAVPHARTPGGSGRSSAWRLARRRWHGRAAG